MATCPSCSLIIRVIFDQVSWHGAAPEAKADIVDRSADGFRTIRRNSVQQGRTRENCDGPSSRSCRWLERARQSLQIISPIRGANPAGFAMNGSIESNQPRRGSAYTCWTLLALLGGMCSHHLPRQREFSILWQHNVGKKELLRQATRAAPFSHRA